MKETEFARCLDSVGRLVIPSKLRTQLHLESGCECAFYIHEMDGETYLCIKCPKQETELEKAIRIITANGMKICDI
jgi:bifunctional DNA-binding transcriptional regulator/antitoxin component of YhaV-PrlF toxin-antitoxin module